MFQRASIKPNRLLLFATCVIFILTLGLLSRSSAASPKFLTLPYNDLDIKIQQGWTFKNHQGIDYIKGASNKPDAWRTFFVRAAADGDAMLKYDSHPDGWGNYVAVKHVLGNDTYYTIYAHLESSHFPKYTWKEVKRGEILGKAGKTGGGANQLLHLHFGAAINDYLIREFRIDPYDLYATRDKYPGWDYKGMGPNHLWITDPPSYHPYIPADINKDNVVDIVDYGILFDNYGRVIEPGTHPADINEDGLINIGDYTILFENYGQVLASSSLQSNLDSASLAVPNPPSNVLFASENNRFGTAVQVKLSWDDNSNDEDGFKFIWDIEGYLSSSIVQNNETPPPTPGAENEGGNSVSSNNTTSMIANIPCEDTSNTRSVSASISAFNATGSSSQASGSGTIDIPACPIPGDANGDRKVDGFDYVAWWQNFGRFTPSGHHDGDFNYDGVVDGFDYVIWWLNYGYGWSSSNNFTKRKTLSSGKEDGLTWQKSYQGSDADQDSLRIFLEPSFAFLPPNKTFRLMFDVKSYPLIFADVEITFDNSLINLTDEIQLTNKMGTVVMKTSKDEANSTGKIEIVLGLQTDNQPPIGLSEFAQLPFGVVTTTPNQTSTLSVVDEEVQLININVDSIPFQSQLAVINPATTHLPLIVR